MGRGGAARRCPGVPATPTRGRPVVLDEGAGERCRGRMEGLHSPSCGGGLGNGWRGSWVSPSSPARKAAARAVARRARPHQTTTAPPAGLAAERHGDSAGAPLAVDLTQAACGGGGWADLFQKQHSLVGTTHSKGGGRGWQRRGRALEGARVALLAVFVFLLSGPASRPTAEGGPLGGHGWARVPHQPASSRGARPKRDAAGSWLLRSTAGGRDLHRAHPSWGGRGWGADSTDASSAQAAPPRRRCKQRNPPRGGDPGGALMGLTAHRMGSVAGSRCWWGVKEPRRAVPTRHALYNPMTGPACGAPELRDNAVWGGGRDRRALPGHGGPPRLRCLAWWVVIHQTPGGGGRGEGRRRGGTQAGRLRRRSARIPGGRHTRRRPARRGPPSAHAWRGRQP